MKTNYLTEDEARQCVRPHITLIGVTALGKSEKNGIIYSNHTGCQASDCGIGWRWRAPTETPFTNSVVGYCGLSGKPEI